MVRPEKHQHGGDMCNTVRLIVVMIVVGVFISSALYAASDIPVSSTKQKASAVIDVGNKICPVMGGKVSGENFYEYKGKHYGLCCPMCEAAFKADPKKYSAIADKEATRK